MEIYSCWYGREYGDHLNAVLPGSLGTGSFHIYGAYQLGRQLLGHRYDHQSYVEIYSCWFGREYGDYLNAAPPRHRFVPHLQHIPTWSM